jgi:hypothetical protein
MTSNVTSTPFYTYWDFADGDAMVCSPHGPPGYRAMCYFNRYCLGGVLVMCGLSCLQDAMRLEKLGQTVAPSTASENSVKTRKQTTRRLRFQKHSYVFGVELLGLAGLHLVNGFATISSTSTIAGMLGDLFVSFTIGLIMYQGLLLMREAEAFRDLIQLPSDATNAKRQRIGLSGALDILQSTGVFPITFGLWVLLACGALTRPVFLSALNVLFTGSGVRSMLENVLNRVRTMLRVNYLQQNAGGDLNTKQRRRGILMTKFRALLFDMVALFLLHVAMPLSILLCGSFYLSTQTLLHVGACDTVTAVFSMIACLKRHQHVNKLLSRHGTQARPSLKVTRQGWRTNTEKQGARIATEFTVADVSGLSVVGDSEVGGIGTRQQAKVGLFSNVESSERAGGNV